MNWDFTLSLTGEKLLPVGTLHSRNLAIEITAPNEPSTWNRAGYLYPLIPVGGGDIPAASTLLIFGAQIIEVPYQNYKLLFKPVPYLKSTYTLKLFKLPMGINNAPIQPEILGGEVITTIPASVIAVVLDPINLARRDGFITNKSNRNLWVNFSSAVVTASAPNNLVTPGSNIEIPESYTGVINGIWSGPNPTLNAEIHQFNAV